MTVCPHCGRSVEAGFRFCDNCGKPLDAEPPKPKADEPTWHTPIVDEKSAPLLERLRRRREDTDEHEIFKPQTTPDEPPPPAPPPAKEIAPKPTATSAPIPAPARTTQTTVETQKIEPAKPVAPWRPVPPSVEEVDPPFTARVGIIWFVHLLIAFAAGLLLLLVAGGVASLLSNGRTALLELRGLPIFLAGATSVIVFTLLRTGRVRLSASRRATAITVVLGFILLVVGSAIAYRPSAMHSSQMRLDRFLRVYGPTEKQAADGLESDISDWNDEVSHYRSAILAPVLRPGNPDINRFRFDASSSEETMKGIVDRMHTHADSANNLRMRDAFDGLASIYDDEMSGINLITRGIIANDQALLKQGETRYEDGQKRTLEFFQLRVKPLLERAGIDPSGFENVVSG